MEIKILHLFPDLMNLYGEYGNIEVLKRHLTAQGFEVVIDKTNSTPTTSLSCYDFIYIGSATEKNELIAAKQLLPIRLELLNAVENDTIILATGNAHELFGCCLIETDKTKHEMLAILPFETHRLEKRVQTDIIYTCPFLTDPIVGFMNRASQIMGIDHPLFEVSFGEGSNKEATTEGYRYRNLFGTYVIGPIFARNPAFTDYMVTLIASKKIEGFSLQEVTYPYEREGYQIVLNQLSKRIKKEKS